MTPEQHAKKLAEARAKHGKPFAHEVHVSRVTQPSIILQDIERKRRPHVLTIVNIKKELTK